MIFVVQTVLLKPDAARFGVILVQAAGCVSNCGY